MEPAPIVGASLRGMLGDHPACAACQHRHRVTASSYEGDVVYDMACTACECVASGAIYEHGRGYIDPLNMAASFRRVGLAYQLGHDADVARDHDDERCDVHHIGGGCALCKLRDTYDSHHGAPGARRWPVDQRIEPVGDSGVGHGIAAKRAERGTSMGRCMPVDLGFRWSTGPRMGGWPTSDRSTRRVQTPK